MPLLAIRPTVNGHYDECSAQYGDGPCDQGSCPARFGAADARQLGVFVEWAEAVDRLVAKAKNGSLGARGVLAAVSKTDYTELVQLGDICSKWKITHLGALVRDELAARRDDDLDVPFTETEARYAWGDR